jgi:hypothetical protein
MSNYIILNIMEGKKVKIGNKINALHKTITKEMKINLVSFM